MSSNVPSQPAAITRRVPRHVLGAAVVGAIATLVLSAAPADAQRRSRLPESLRGSRASVEKMYEFAQANRMPFYLTPTNISHAVRAGRLVPLTGDGVYELTRGVGFSYATSEAKQFLLAFAPQYQAACGTPLTVTSAARPKSRQPRNSNPHSVHPTGIAIDLRRPYAGPCLDWLRKSLAELEAKGVVEATEERHPAHMHVAVLAAPGRTVSLPPLPSGTLANRPVTPVHQAGVSASAGDVALAAPSSPAAIGTGASPARADTAAVRHARTYRVREGDTLWDVARRNGVSVQALARANKRSPRAVLRPGVTLRLPDAKGR